MNKKIKRNYALTRPPQSMIPPEMDDKGFTVQRPAKPAAQRPGVNLDPRTYQEGYRQQQLERQRAAAAAGGGQRPPPARPTTAAGGYRPPPKAHAPAFASALPPQKPQKKQITPLAQPVTICEVSQRQFLEELQNARERCGGFEALAYVVSQLMCKRVGVRSFFQWQKGEVSPPTQKMCRIYAALLQAGRRP